MVPQVSDLRAESLAALSSRTVFRPKDLALASREAAQSCYCWACGTPFCELSSVTSGSRESNTELYCNLHRFSNGVRLLAVHIRSMRGMTVVSRVELKPLY